MVKASSRYGLDATGEAKIRGQAIEDNQAYSQTQVPGLPCGEGAGGFPDLGPMSPLEQERALG